MLICHCCLYAGTLSDRELEACREGQWRWLPYGSGSAPSAICQTAHTHQSLGKRPRGLWSWWYYPEGNSARGSPFGMVVEHN